MLSFLPGSTGGYDGLRAQHIRDMLLCREAGPEFLSAPTAFVNLVLAGGCPVDVAPVFFGGRLISLNKKSGGIRAIAVDFTFMYSHLVFTVKVYTQVADCTGAFGRRAACGESGILDWYVRQSGREPNQTNLDMEGFN